MATRTLTSRVARLEKTVAELLNRQPAGQGQDINDLISNGPRPPGRDDWMKVVGMFDGDDVMRRIDEHGAAIRRAERRKSRRA